MIWRGAEKGSMDRVLPAEEYIEQAYFLHQFRQQLAMGLATQEVLERVHEEILSTTVLPMAIQFLGTELKHSGILSSGMKRLAHYFTAFQAFVIGCAEDPKLRFPLETALLILEREAEYRSRNVTVQGLFVYHLESLSRNRLGYDGGIAAMSQDPYYDESWRSYFELVRHQIGLVELADLVYLRSDLHVNEQRARDAGYEPVMPPLFGEKEGKIAKANRARDPLFLFAALQRQLGYPEVPRPKPRDDASTKLEEIQRKLYEVETRLKLLESEVRGQVDLSKFGKPELLQDDEEEKR
jgi:hypothetical protein